jgi:hypothetical protein
MKQDWTYGPVILIAGIVLTVSTVRSKRGGASLGWGIVLIAVGVLLTGLRLAAFAKSGV